MNAEVTLPPCPTPWCNGPEDDPYVWQGPDDQFTVICGGCQVEGPHCETEAEAIAAWNTRAAMTPNTPPPERVEAVARAIHVFLSRRNIMQYLDNDEDCEGIARAAIAALTADPSRAVGEERGGTEQHLCGHCGAQYLLMGADYLDRISEALDRAGAPRWSEDRTIMLPLIGRIEALREPRHEPLDDGSWLNRHDPPAPADDVEAFGWVSEIEWHKPAHRAVMANVALGSWMSAALDDPKVCEAMKADIREWFSAGEPMELLGQALAHFRALAASPPREQENG